jgi:hypothetical protein
VNLRHCRPCGRDRLQTAGSVVYQSSAGSVLRYSRSRTVA